MDVILQDKIPVTLAGKEYLMKRISTKEVFSFAKLVNKAVAEVGIEAMEGAEDPTKLGLLLMTAMTGNGEIFAEFYAPILGITPDEFLAMPPEAAADFMEELPKHQDMKAFFTAVTRVMQAMGSLWQSA